MNNEDWEDGDCELLEGFTAEEEDEYNDFLDEEELLAGHHEWEEKNEASEIMNKYPKG